MNRLLLLTAAAILSVSAAAQSLEVEYYWDSDPGLGAATTTTVPVSNDGSIQFSAPTTGLTPGRHRLFVRAYHKNGDNCHFAPTLVKDIDVFDPVRGTNLQLVEYFWDTDPGYGNATRIDIGTSGLEATLNNLSIPVANVTPGEHLLGIRAMGANRWGPTITQKVTVLPKGDNRMITLVEYFWDTDPGLGQGTLIEIETPGLEATLDNLSIPVANVTSREHLLGIRVMGANHWGPTITQKVTVLPKGDDRMITLVEYFWDTDPGFGNGTSFEITAGQDVTIDNVFIAKPAEITDELTNHVLGFRAFGNGHWGPTYMYALNTPLRYINEDDKAALTKLYTDLGGANWNGTIWTTEADYIRSDNWSGVSFNSENRVTGIDLTARGVTGNLSSTTAMSALPYMTSLNLSRNALTGDPGLFLANNQQLTSINLSYNQLDELTRTLPINATIDLSNQHRTYRNDYNYPGLESIVTKPEINVGSTMTSLALPAIWGYNHKSQQLNNHPDLYADKTTNRNIVGTLIWDESKGGYVFSGFEKHVDVDDATELVLDVIYSSDLRYSAYPAIIHFTSGDADMSGVVDVTDVQRTLVYVLGTEEYATPPISLWAANTYTTGETSRMINIQDIVCTVNIVLDNQSQSARAYMTRSATEQQDMRNYFYADGHDVMLNAQDEVGAFDLELQGVTPQQVRLALNANDWQMVTRQTAGGGTRLIVLSPTGAKLPTGITKLLSLDGDGMPIAVTATSPNAIELKAGVLGTSPTGIDEIKQHSDLRVTADHGQIILSTSMAGGQTTVSVYGAQGILLSKHHLKSLPAGQTKLPLSSEENLLIVKVQSAETGTKIFKLQTTK